MSRLHYFLIAINFASPSLSHCSLISSLSSPPLSHLLALISSALSSPRYYQAAGVRGSGDQATREAAKFTTAHSRRRRCNRLRFHRLHRLHRLRLRLTLFSSSRIALHNSHISRRAASRRRVAAAAARPAYAFRKDTRPGLPIGFAVAHLDHRPPPHVTPCIISAVARRIC